MRRKSGSVRERNRGLIEKIREIKVEHPFWGYRRVWAYLRYVQGLPVNRKRVLRLMREGGLLVKPNLRLKALRTPMRSKPKPTCPNQWWGIDMTKVMVETFGWIYVVLVLDWYSKKIVGFYTGLPCRARHWLEALEKGFIQQFPFGVRGQKLHLMSDNGCQPTSVTFMKACHSLEIQQAFTSYNNPKGNADTERVIRTMKEELLWLHEWTSPFQLEEALEKWIRSYNEEYLHSTLGYVPPAEFERRYQNSHVTPLTNA